MKISVIVPVYNEEQTISTILEHLIRIPCVVQIIVVNDGSTDGSRKKIEKIKHKKIQTVHLDRNRGKGHAVTTGLDKVSQEYVLIQDADLEYHPDDIELLTSPIEQRENVQVVYGSRFLGPHSNLLFWHLMGNRFLNFLVNILYNTTLSDMETCYKLIPTKLFRELNVTSNGFNIEPEVTCKILKKGYRIYEVPISYVGRDFSQGKKITWKDGIGALITIIQYRF